MKYTDIKIGDRVRIAKSPDKWNSIIGGISPLTKEGGPKYPWEGIIERMDNVNYKEGVVVISGYGFSFETISECMELFPSYEIY